MKSNRKRDNNIVRFDRSDFNLPFDVTGDKMRSLCGLVANHLVSQGVISSFETSYLMIKIKKQQAGIVSSVSFSYHQFLTQFVFGRLHDHARRLRDAKTCDNYGRVRLDTLCSKSERKFGDLIAAFMQTDIVFFFIGPLLYYRNKPDDVLSYSQDFCARYFVR
jgi:hypothetical protein